jgi:thymidylate synthase
MNDYAKTIEDDNLSYAWARAFLAVMTNSGNEVSPLIVSATAFNEGDPLENEIIRHELDVSLAANGKRLCETVANTIFPKSLWNPQRPRGDLSKRYLAVLPRIRAADRANCHGTYFERFIAFGTGDRKIDQLDFIISTWLKGNHRRSSLQLAVFDPASDHTEQRQRGFPCLQHVFFAPVGDSGLSVTGIYAMQYIYERAYGNYLGLCRLGHFVAHELGLQLVQMNCFAGVARLGVATKGELATLASKVEQAIHTPRTQ